MLENLDSSRAYRTAELTVNCFGTVDFILASRNDVQEMQREKHLKDTRQAAKVGKLRNVALFEVQCVFIFSFRGRNACSNT